jgi:methanogenic corrinoid protein MtbC1
MSENSPLSEPYADLARSYMEALLRGDRQTASRLVMEAVENGVSVRDIYLHVLHVSRREIGRLWQLNRISVAPKHVLSQLIFYRQALAEKLPSEYAREMTPFLDWMITRQ